MNATTTTTGEVLAFELQRCGIVTTKYLPPTNHRGSRVKATSGSGRSVTLSWDYALDAADNHAAAAAHLAADILSTTADRLILRGGCLASDGYAFAIQTK